MIYKLDILTVPPGRSRRGVGGEVSGLSGEEMETTYIGRVCKSKIS